MYTEEDSVLLHRLLSSLIICANTNNYDNIILHIELYNNQLLELTCNDPIKRDTILTSISTTRNYLLECMSPSEYYIFLRFFFLKILNISEILPGVYLSGLDGGYNESVLQFLGINHVIRILDGSHFCNRVRYNNITSTDIDAPDRHPRFVERILKTGIKSSYEHYINGDSILIHCRMGISRSASVAIGLIMKIMNINYDKAFDIVKMKRPIIKPFRGFSEHLKFIII